ncbi:hypothetical protein [Aeromicrobium sp.]
MTASEEPDEAGPAMVTIFGDGQEMDSALAAVFDRYGSRSHVVTTPTGWLRTSDLVVARLDTPAGVVALRDLANQETRSARIVCICQDPGSVATAEDLAMLCSQCGDRHHVTLLWHPPVAASSAESHGQEKPATHSGQEVLATDLAELVVHEISVFVGPQFDQRSVSIDENGEPTR